VTTDRLTLDVLKSTTTVSGELYVMTALTTATHKSPATCLDSGKFDAVTSRWANWLALCWALRDPVVRITPQQYRLFVIFTGRWGFANCFFSWTSKPNELPPLTECSTIVWAQRSTRIVDRGYSFRTVSFRREKCWISVIATRSRFNVMFSFNDCVLEGSSRIVDPGRSFRMRRLWIL